MCREHNDFVSLYCVDDKQLMCVSCLYHTEKHKKHKVQPLKNSLAQIENETKLYRHSALEKLLKVEESLKICSENK